MPLRIELVDNKWTWELLPEGGWSGEVIIGVEGGTVGMATLQVSTTNDIVTLIQSVGNLPELGGWCEGGNIFQRSISKVDVP